MPWGSGDASKHTKKADTPQEQELWQKVANSARRRGLSDAEAIREANGVVAKRQGGGSKPGLVRRPYGG